MEKSRTVVVAIESADLKLAERWSSEGSLPFLGSMLGSAPLVVLRTPIQVLQIAAWASILTGTSSGRLGQYNLWSQIRNGTYLYEGRRNFPNSIRRYDDILADHGVSVTVADIPADSPFPGYRGQQIVDWGTEFRFGDIETVPASLAEDVLREFGPYPMPAVWNTGDSQSGHVDLVRRLEQGIKLKGALTRRLIQQPGVEHVFSAFAELHKGAHWCWKYMDTSHVDHEDAPEELRDAVRRLYVGVDRELASIAGQLGPQDNLIVFSEQGMQSNYRGDHLVEPVLEKLGLLHRTAPAPLEETLRPRRPDVVQVQSQRQQTRSPQRLRKFAKALLPEALRWQLKSLREPPTGIDWSRTRVFKLPTDRSSFFRVNLRGREPRGCVEPGAEYEALLDRLEAELRALRNGTTGRPAVSEVFRLRDLFPGERTEDLPDLAAEWDASSPVDSLQSPSIGMVALAVRELRSGNHRSEGFLLAKGPAFAAGGGRVAGDFLQIAPTLLRTHGVPAHPQFEMGPLPILRDAV